MSHLKTLKLLLVEDDLEDERLLSEAFLEIEDTPHWRNWDIGSVLHVELLSDALDCLQRDGFDAVLLNLSLPDCPVLLDSFRLVNSCSRGAPIIVLADEEDEDLASLLLREGVQDVLLKSELDCAPLAKSLRYAIERQRRAIGNESWPFLDHLTRAFNAAGFLTIANQCIQLAQLNNVPLLMASIELSPPSKQLPEGRERRELLLVRAAEALAAAFQPPALLGRIGENRFALMTAGLAETTVDALLNRAVLAIEDAARLNGPPASTVRFSVAPLDQRSSLEELLGQDSDEFAARTHRRAKTAMLAD